MLWQPCAGRRFAALCLLRAPRLGEHTPRSVTARNMTTRTTFGKEHPLYKSAGAFSFGAATRDQANKLFVSQVD